MHCQSANVRSRIQEVGTLCGVGRKGIKRNNQCFLCRTSSSKRSSALFIPSMTGVATADRNVLAQIGSNPKHFTIGEVCNQVLNLDNESCRMVFTDMY